MSKEPPHLQHDPADGPTGHRRAVIYARVSSKEQEREGFSIPAQLRLLRDYAQDRGIAIAEEFVDVETAKQSGRAGFNQMVRYLKRRSVPCRVILVEKTDRLYRNLKDWVTLDDLDIDIHFVKEGAISQPPILDPPRSSCTASKCSWPRTSSTICRRKSGREWRKKRRRAFGRAVRPSDIAIS